MRKLLVLLTLTLGLVACGNGNAKNKKSAAPENTKDRTEVLYFHGKQRCATCMAIEQNTRAVVEEQFADELKNGTLVFRIIDISEPENEAIADKYEVTWSSLIVSRWQGGKESAENLTEYAFANARTAPETFREGLAAKIRELQK